MKLSWHNPLLWILTMTIMYNIKLTIVSMEMDKNSKEYDRNKPSNVINGMNHLTFSWNNSTVQNLTKDSNGAKDKPHNYMSAILKFSPLWCNSGPPVDNRPFCSYEVYQSYFSKCNKFPEMGYWTNINITYIDQAQRNRNLRAGDMDPGAIFKSPLCIMPPVDGKRVHDEINKRNIRHIFMAGDSHGVRYFYALRRILQTVYHCDVIFEEPLHTSMLCPKEYLVRQLGLGSEAIAHTRRGCSTCRTTLLSCTDSSNNTLRVEFIGMAFKTDPWLPSPQFCMNHSSDPKYSSFCSINSTLDLIYDYHLAARKPQVVITASTLCHDVGKFKSTGEFLDRYEHLNSLIKKLKPQTNMWLTSPYFKAKRDQDNEKNAVFNRRLFELIQKDLTQKKPVMIAGTNIFNMTKPIHHIKIKEDINHYSPVFYDEAMKELLTLWMTSDSTQ